MDARVTENAPTPRADLAGRRPIRRQAAAVRAVAAQSPALGEFQANRRGYWALWLFLVLFFVSLFAEFIANDKPFLILMDGRAYFPAVVTYPETTFGGDFETAADYRDPYLQKLIAEKGGTMIWPPIRYSYDTHNLDLPTPAPSPPTWMLTEEQCKPVVEKKGLSGCRDLEYNWLGTDDQGRDVVARLIYGFRISVLFGLILTIISSVDRRRRRRGAGLFRRLDRSVVPARHRDLDLGAVALSAADHFLGAGAGLLRAARDPAAVLLGVAGRAGARRIPARPQLRIHPGRARARRLQRHHHVPASAAERHGRDHDVPAVHPVVVGDDADRARLPRLRLAARLAVARRTAVAGQDQHPGAVARPRRLLHRSRSCCRC